MQFLKHDINIFFKNSNTSNLLGNLVLLSITKEQKLVLKKVNDQIMYFQRSKTYSRSKLINVRKIKTSFQVFFKVMHSFNHKYLRFCQF
jgi:hypothetical protein